MKRPILLAIALAACHHEPAKPGEVVTFQTVCTAKYAEIDGAADGPVYKRVTLEGYIGAPSMMVCSDDSCSVDLYPTAAAQGKSVGAYLKVGNGANEMSKLPEKFEPSDVKLHTIDGKVLGVGAKVRVTGERMGSAGDPTVCAINDIDLVETP